MQKTMLIQGKKITYKDIELVRQMIRANPSWNRTRLSRELCILWNWHAANGQMKDMASRSFLLKLERRGYITLPARERSSGGNRGKKMFVPYVPHSTLQIRGELKEITPISIQVVKDKEHLLLFQCLLSSYHYLRFGGTVGENLKYLVFDKDKRPLACLLFGSAAWKIAPGIILLAGMSLPEKRIFSF